MDNKIIYACIEHVEISIDDIVNEKEIAPFVEKIDNNEEDENNFCKCFYCDNLAAYKISCLKD